MAEHRAGAVMFFRTVSENAFKQIVVLIHRIRASFETANLACRPGIGQ